MTNRETGTNVVREMMGDLSAAKLSASADSNTFGAPIAAYAVDQVSLRLNQRPRKTLGFQTPADKLQASVASTV
jgi:hypothetical protein